MEETLFLQHKGNHPKDLKLVTANNDSPQAVSIRQYKQEVAERYKGDWERFFTEWRFNQEEFQGEVIEQLKQNEKKANLRAQEANLKAQEVLEQYENLYHQHLKNQNQVEVFHQQALQNQQEKQEKEGRKLKRKQATIKTNSNT